MYFPTFLIQILNGAQYGMLLFLVASGLTLVFGIMGIINIAHHSCPKQLMTLGHPEVCRV